MAAFLAPSSSNSSLLHCRNFSNSHIPTTQAILAFPTSNRLWSFQLVSGFSGQKLKVRQHGNRCKSQAPYFLLRANVNKNGSRISHELTDGGEHFLDDLSCWISKKAAAILHPHLPEGFDLLDWMPSSWQAKIHSSERAATIFVRECLLFGISCFFFTRAEKFCQWLNWVHLSKTRHGQEVTDADYQGSAFHAMQDPLRAGIMLWAITRIIHMSAPLLKLRFGLDMVDKVRSAGLILSITWFLFRWKNLEMEKLISRHKVNAPRIIAVDKVVSLVMYYLTGTCIGEFLGFRLRSVLAIGGMSGIAVGIAAKEIVGNFLGGALLFMTRPFVIGDKIQAKSFAGEVEDIEFLHTKLVGFDKSPVLVPNLSILSEVIVNYSRAKSKLLAAVFQLRVGDIFLVDRITEKITEYLCQHPEVDPDNDSQRPVCYLKAMGTKGLDIELLCVICEKGVPFYKTQQEILVKAAHIITAEGASLETSNPVINATIVSSIASTQTDVATGLV